MSLRAGIVVTGTEVLSGRVVDRNGPWLSERLFELGVDTAWIEVVGDRTQDLKAALRFLAGEGADLIVTSGGLGPTADDLTAAAVGEFQGREMVVDEALQERIAQIVAPLMRRWPNIDLDAVTEANRKQATIPRGADVLAPAGTAPGLVVAPAQGDGPPVVVLPGPPRELQQMWRDAIAAPALERLLAGAGEYRSRTLRLFGIPESEIAQTLREAEREGIELARIEVTTCLKRGEVEVVTRYEPGDEPVCEALEELIARRHAEALFSRDGSTVDEQVAQALRSRALSVASAESCTGGLLAARLTELAGSSDYFKGGVVAYANEAKVELAGVAGELIAAHGAVSREVAEALARGARARVRADVGVGVTGIAGPGGGTEEKPVGLVWLSVDAGGEPLTRSVTLPGSRADVRDRATTVAMHLIRRALAAR